MRFLAPSWEDIYTKSIKLAENIVKSGEKFDSIIGISKGGLVPSRILSDLLEIPDVLITKCEYYVDVAKKSKKPIITQKIPGTIRDKDVLIADDVADTGDSLIEVVKYLKSKAPKSLKVATIYLKPWSKVIPDFYAAKTDAWIIFPWELNESMRSLSSLNGGRIVRKTHMPSKYMKAISKINRQKAKTT